MHAETAFLYLFAFTCADNMPSRDIDNPVFAVALIPITVAAGHILIVILDRIAVIRKHLLQILLPRRIIVDGEGHDGIVPQAL